jgi:KDO2-lipid IV(A) lauroyltransferase
MKKIRFLIEYYLVLIPYSLLRISPHWLIIAVSKFVGNIIFLMPVYGRIATANVRSAFPEMSPAEAARIGRCSLQNLAVNMCEFFWVAGKPQRITRYMEVEEATAARMRMYAERNELAILVNPHLGSWEGSAIVATHLCNVKMVAIAKMTRNPYVNDLLNKKSREIEGLKIIYSKGAMRETIKAVHQGYAVGTLIDQNTRVRDGGIFINFFNLPVPCSKAPATLWRYCQTNNIPAVLLYATTLRINGKLVGHCEPVAKPLAEYADDEEIIQELMHLTEKYIRQYPEQYLWFYRRFQYIPQEIDTATRQRYPFYATVADQKFYRKKHLPAE